jgi:hypothetical protein
VPPYDFNSVSEPYINTPRTARWVTTPQVLDNLEHPQRLARVSHGLNFRFLPARGPTRPTGRHQRHACVTFSATTRPAFLGTTGNSGFSSAPNINSTDQTLLGSLINNLYGLPASMNQVFISNLKDNAFLPFKIGDQITLYARNTISISTTSSSRTNGRCVRT